MKRIKQVILELRNFHNALVFDFLASYCGTEILLVFKEHPKSSEQKYLYSGKYISCTHYNKSSHKKRNSTIGENIIRTL